MFPDRLSFLFWQKGNQGLGATSGSITTGAIDPFQEPAASMQSYDFVPVTLAIAEASPLV